MRLLRWANDASLFRWVNVYTPSTTQIDNRNFLGWLCGLTWMGFIPLMGETFRSICSPVLLDSGFGLVRRLIDRFILTCSCGHVIVSVVTAHSQGRTGSRVTFTKPECFFPASLILLSILTSGKTYPVRQRTVTDSPTWYRSFTGDTTELGVTFPGHSITTRENNSKSSST